jgi:hypothetical protein
MVKNKLHFLESAPFHASSANGNANSTSQMRQGKDEWFYLGTRRLKCKTARLA